MSVTTWADLDRGDEPDHLTTLWVPHLNVPVAASIQGLAEAVAGEQPHRPEVAEASALGAELRASADAVSHSLAAFDLDSGDGADRLCAALGRELGGVARAARLAERAGWFSLADIADVAAADVTAGKPAPQSAPGTDPTGS